MPTHKRETNTLDRIQPHIEGVVLSAISNARAYIGQTSKDTLLYNVLLLNLQALEEISRPKDQSLGEALFAQRNEVSAVLESMKYVVSNLGSAAPTHLFTIVSALAVLWADALNNKLNGTALADLLRYQATPPTLKVAARAA